MNDEEWSENFWESPVENILCWYQKLLINYLLYLNVFPPEEDITANNSTLNIFLSHFYSIFLSKKEKKKKRKKEREAYTFQEFLRIKPS